MSAAWLLSLVLVYFLVLLGIAWWTGRGAGGHAFFSGDRRSLWWVVAFGMIGTSLSGVTFISVPGWVKANHWSYLQVVVGYVIGYWVVAGVLLPLYYRLQLTSIYGYLRHRFGPTSYRTGAAFFLLSRTLGATIRIYLVLNVLQLTVVQGLGEVPFAVTAALILLMIVLYTVQGGVRTIVWTDTLQTLFMLAALLGTVAWIAAQPGMGDWWSRLQGSGMTAVWDLDWRSDGFFLKQVLSGMFITIAMTGLDQEMMQKNLSVATVQGAQKNMRVFSVVLLGVNLLFLVLGGLLYLYAEQAGFGLPERSDDLFPSMALQLFPPWLGLLFIIGLISALFPSADGALTALTASTCIDLIGIRERGWDEARQTRVRKTVHLAIAAVFFGCVMFFHWLQSGTVLKTLLDIAGYTYGPLLGLFAYGILFKGRPAERWVPVVCVLAPLFTFVLKTWSPDLLFGYRMGFETLIVNGALTLLGLRLISGPSR
ncbi:MAG: sodium:solute symporter [Flavobacteriales bacterium]|nr:sodium:solute symporter [Flavobacteriales bacterium]